MKISIVLAAETANFETDMNRASKAAQKRMKEIERNVKESGRAIGQAFALIGGGLLLMTKQALDAADKLNDMRQQTGLTAEQLQALGNIAEKSGSDLDSIGSAISKFNKNISEGAASSSTDLNDQALAFQALGVSIEDLKSKNTAELLEQVSKKLSTFKDDANKAALEMALFGKSGAELAPTLNALGQQGLQPTIDKLREMGVLISDETIKAADDFNDKLVDAKAITTAFKVQLAEAMLPTLNNLVDHFTDGAGGADKFRGSAETLAKAFQGVLVVAIALKSAAFTLARALATAGGVAGDLLEGMTAADFANPFTQLAKIGQNAIKNRERIAAGVSGNVEDMTAAMADDFEFAAEIVKKGGEAISAEMRAVEKKIEEEAPSLEGLKNQRDQANKDADKAAAEAKKRDADAKKRADDAKKDSDDAFASLKKMIAAQEEQIATFGMSEAAVLAYKVQTGELAGTIELAGDRAKGFGAILIENQQILDDKTGKAKEAEKAIEAFAAELDFAQGVVDGNRTEVQVLEAQLVRLRAAYDTATEGADVLAAAMVITQKNIEEANEKNQDTFFDLEEAAKEASRNIHNALADFLFNPFEEGLDGMLKGFAEMLTRMAAEAAANAILQSIFGDKGVEGAIQGIFSLFGGGKAAGGPVSAGTSYIVGEHGPERFLPAVDGRIVPNHELGGNTEVNVINAPAGTRVVRRQDSRKDIVDVLIADLNENGPFTSQFAGRHGLSRRGS